MGAWIEITVEVWTEGESNVAPLVGAWIEIKRITDENQVVVVAPLVGAWIEIIDNGTMGELINRRSPCGSVD